jgi:prepilin-type N-terminal cleavage/methylation domain-containing protein
MKQSVNGFTLVELVIVVAISGLLSSVLYTIFQQTTKTARSLIKTLDTDEAIALLYSQLEKDISSACIPAIMYEQLKKKKEANKENKAETDEPQKENKEVEKKNKELTHLFFAGKDSNTHNYLTFISTNSLSNYSVKKPKLARIIYSIVPDETQDNSGISSYSLMREERQDIFSWESKAKTIKTYALIRQLKNLTFSFIGASQNKDNEEKKYATYTQWPQEDTAKDTQSNPQLLPEYVICEGDLWDSQKRKTTHFAFEYKIIASMAKEEQKAANPAPPEPAKKEKQEKTVVITQVEQA